MLVLPDSTRKFYVDNIPAVNSSITDIYEDMLAIRRVNCPNYTDESPADFGNQLLYLFATLSHFMLTNHNRLLRNMFIGSTDDREVMRRLCRLIGYSLSESAPATATVTFTLESGHPGVTIPALTKVSNLASQDSNQVIFEVISDTVVTAGVTSAEVQVIQGETIQDEVIGSSDATTDQQYSLQRKQVIWESESIEIYNGSVWETWTRVDNFIDSSGTDKHYRVAVDSLGQYLIIFGNGENGLIPLRGNNNIRASYRVGAGSEGNISAGSITELIDSITYVVSITNSSAASGGIDRESIEHARIYGPANLRALDRTVTAEDVETIVNSFVSSSHGGVATSKAYEAGGYVVHVMVVPRYGGNPSAELKNEIQAYLQLRRMICTSVTVIDPVYQNVDITVSLNLHKNYEANSVSADVIRRLINYLSPTYQDPETGLYTHGFGRDIYLSDLYAIIDGTNGVNYCQITAPTGNVIIPENQIADVGTISITVNTSTGTQSYIDTKTDRKTQINLA